MAYAYPDSHLFDSSYQEPHKSPSYQEPHKSHSYQEPHKLLSYLEPHKSHSYQEPQTSASYQEPQTSASYQEPHKSPGYKNGRVKIQVYRGPNKEKHGYDSFAPWGYYVTQPEDQKRHSYHHRY